MSTHTKIKNISFKSAFMRILLVVFATFLVMIFMPKDEASRLRYDIGKPWLQSTVIAKFQFPVYKSDSVLKAEKDSVLKSFQPYYKINPDVERKALSEFAQRFDRDATENTPNIKYIVIQELSKLYQQGIMEQTEYHNISTDTTSTIRVIYGKDAIITPINNVLSIKNAYQHLFENKLLLEEKQATQRYNLTDFIRPNLVYDEEKNESEKHFLLEGIAETDNIIMSGQKIIDRGDIVTSETARILDSLEKELQQQKTENDLTAMRSIGQSLVIFGIILLFGLYLMLYRDDYFLTPQRLLMTFSFIIISPIIVSLFARSNILNVYALPIAMTPIFIRIFLDSRTAFMAHIASVLLCAIAVKYQFEFIIVEYISGVVSIFALRELSKRSQIIKAAAIVTLCGIGAYLSIQLVQNGEIIMSDWNTVGAFFVSGVVLMLVYPLMFIIEKIFGFTSAVTLFELSDTNKEILRELSEKAPGTFQHSVTVGNIAAEVANKIGAKALLVRTGALYHDIGKMANPVFFTENQSGFDPHSRLSYKESAQIIIGHIKEGVRLAEKHKLPKVIKDFIITHHGAGIAKYFYISYKNEHPDEEVDIKDFSYPGPDPFTKEQAILMMADSVEAASHSLSEHTEEAITDLVNKIINTQVNEGRFTNCPITFHDISIAKETLIYKLKAIYHTRIKYPTQKQE